MVAGEWLVWGWLVVGGWWWVIGRWWLLFGGWWWVGWWVGWLGGWVGGWGGGGEVMLHCSVDIDTHVSFIHLCIYLFDHLLVCSFYVRLFVYCL